ncbi:MAG: aminotransferase class I/II-fold pyridoxal phosphate-dependent enzyme [Synechococcaceae cyanobacterium]|nr:aminotransferase class I/II-fold pyridoxal phosphate-dependent enzyme [Synechococcaceae cyanobacterium]
MPAIPPEAAPSIDAVLDPIIPRVSAWMAQRADALSLAQGMVHWLPPERVDAAVIEALHQARHAPHPRDNLHRYGAGAGDPELLAAIATQLSQHHQVDLSASELWVTAGSNMAFQLVVRAICDPGDAVIVPLPWYFNHAMAIQLAGAEPVGVAAGLVPDPDILAAAITPRTRAIVTVSPGNPSGVVMPRSVLSAIGALCARHGLFHLSDEAYALFTHGSEPHWSPGSAGGSGAHTVTFQTFSKAYGMAGWRLGYAAVPRQLGPALRKLQDTVLIAPSRVVQRAGVAALAAGPAWCQAQTASLAPARRRLREWPNQLRRQGVEARWLAPLDGAFYGLLEVAGPLAGEALVRRLLLEFGVATLPGESFGLPTQPGRAVLRLSYGMLRGEALERALQRLGQGLLQLAQS